MSARLTVQERQLRAMSEAEWQSQVTQLAEAHGYSWCHFRPAQTAHGWRVPVEGPLGKGWPDLCLFGRGRTIFAELKRETESDLSEEQRWVHERIRAGGGEMYTWRPSQIDEVIAVLGGAR